MVFKADFLPWFSNDTSEIDWSKVAAAHDDALQSYYGLINAFLTALQPRWIQCNGKQSSEVAETLFGCRLSEKIAYSAEGKKFSFFVGVTSTPISVPIIVHSFGRYNGADSFSAIAKQCHTLLGESMFRFE